jgi:phage baseplate assembly protein W
MSFSLALEDGDLVRKGASFGIVYGVEKLTQDLRLWLTESYGGDMMHPELGSMLDSWIGGIISPSTKSEVQAEVLRVLQNYQAVQLRGIRTVPQKYSMSEILYSVNDVKVVLNYDTVAVTISVSTAPPQTQTATVTAVATTV